jgi:hypothetical protein
MKKFSLLFFVAWSMYMYTSCDHITNPYPPQVILDLDTTLYPGNWADYVANEWPTFTVNTNIDRNILIEDYTGQKRVRNNNPLSTRGYEEPTNEALSLTTHWEGSTQYNQLSLENIQ